MHSKRYNLLAETIETGMYATGADQPVNPRSLIKAFSVQNIFCSIEWVCAWTTEALIRLPEYAGWPGPSLYAYAIKAFFSWSVVYICFYRKIKIMSKSFTIKFVTYAAVYELNHCYIQALLLLFFFFFFQSKEILFYHIRTVSYEWNVDYFKLSISRTCTCIGGPRTKGKLPLGRMPTAKVQISIQTV